MEVPGDVQPGAIFRADPGRYSSDRQNMVELYDLFADPLEEDNVAGSANVTEVEAEMDRRLRRWMEETKDPLLLGPVPSPRFRKAVERRAGSADSL